MNTKEPITAHILDRQFVAQVEAAHFRTAADTGANHNALMIWNIVRRHVGLPELTPEDLPAWCMTHSCYHTIRKTYGCRPIETKEDAEKAFNLPNR